MSELSKSLIEKLLDLARKYADKKGLKLSTLGTKVMNDGAFFTKLEAGQTCTVQSYAKAIEWLWLKMPEEEFLDLRKAKDAPYENNTASDNQANR